MKPGPHAAALVRWGRAWVHLGVIAAAAALWLLGDSQSAQADTPHERVVFVCEAAYLPSRNTWRRTVEIEHNEQRILKVRIDGVEVFTFAVYGTLVMTGLDNERIQIDTATQIWTSDFRGMATSRGHCERAR